MLLNSVSILLILSLFSTFVKDKKKLRFNFNFELLDWFTLSFEKDFDVCNLIC